MNKQTTIVATNGTLKSVVREEISRLGCKADLNHIDVSQVTSMRELFYVSPFNGGISRWDVSSVVDMGRLFAFSVFNRDVSNWDVSSVTNMTWMFAGSDFNFIEDIEKWKIDPAKVDTKGMFKGTKLEHSPLAKSLNC